MISYKEQAHIELQFWQLKMLKKPSLTDRLSKRIQNRINGIIPEKVHHAITLTMEKMVKGVLYGAKFTTGKPAEGGELSYRESLVKQQISFYQKTAGVEGAVTGAGGILMGIADFPILIGIKIKLLFEIALLYGYDVNDYKERLFILYIFQLAFSSQESRNIVYMRLANWKEYSHSLTDEADEFDWRSFQQEYRDYIDIAKMAQLVPVIGAAVGAIANYKLVQQLGSTAMNCYRMRETPLLLSI